MVLVVVMEVQVQRKQTIITSILGKDLKIGEDPSNSN